MLKVEPRDVTEKVKAGGDAPLDTEQQGDKHGQNGRVTRAEKGEAIVGGCVDGDADGDRENKDDGGEECGSGEILDERDAHVPERQIGNDCREWVSAVVVDVAIQEIKAAVEGDGDSEADTKHTQELVAHGAVGFDGHEALGRRTAEDPFVDMVVGPEEQVAVGF